MRGDLNRLLNAESATLGRIVAASARQLEAIDTLLADGRLARLPEPVRAVAATRRTIPEASLAELADELGEPRGRVQRALERIESLALHPADDEPPTPRSRRRAERPGHDGPGASTDTAPPVA